VTFHTPPYAAIEQYVKTYPQGPWTDIYALGVVMYECITGEKPAEVLERLHAGLGKPLADGKWPGYTKKFLAAVDAAMIVKPEDRPQSLSAWLAMFGRAGQPTDVADDEATRFYAKDVESEEIVPVPPTPNVDPKAPVETGVPANPKDAKFKRVGEETGASRKAAAEKKAAEDDASRRRVPELAAAEAADAKAPAKAASKTPSASKDAAKKPNTAIMAGAAVAVVAVLGIGALALRGGSSNPEITQAAPAADNAAGAQQAAAPAETAPDANAVANAAGNVAAPADQSSAQTNTVQQAIDAEKAKTAAAQAQLQALKKAQAKAAAAKAPGAPTASTRQADRRSATASQSASASSDAGVSSATVSAFNATIDDARSMAKQVMRSGSAQNVQLAKNYDQYLKTLKDSMRGIQSEREAQKLLKQANQTRAYIVFLQRQPH
jgi:hypothetical protein